MLTLSQIRFRDKLNHLHRQKEKLEEKIMEHYKKLESCSTTKKKRFGASLVKRMRKAGAELLTKVAVIGKFFNETYDFCFYFIYFIFRFQNRRSWAEDSKQSESKTSDSESECNDSDASMDDHRVKKEQTEPPVLEGDALSLGTPGTRRTVYYTDDLPSPATSLPVSFVFSSFDLLISQHSLVHAIFFKISKIYLSNYLEI